MDLEEEMEQQYRMAEISVPSTPLLTMESSRQKINKGNIGFKLPIRPEKLNRHLQNISFYCSTMHILCQCTWNIS